ncbi:MAG: hypothetical protein ABSA23_15865 [Anaerolineales bacterium]
MDATKGTPEQTRAEEALFVNRCGLLSLWKNLPLHWPTPAGMPASLKKHYRSEYVSPWRSAVADPDQVLAWKGLSDFDLALRLVDFRGLRPVRHNFLAGNPGEAGNLSTRFPFFC